ncbi:hypothetical protein HJFPF1_02698 [Paramyrothecium foliicola]|nr:hypothetical protein HJFPF1_02698 [Paramyrothecium foliicola]
MASAVSAEPAAPLPKIPWPNLVAVTYNKAQLACYKNGLVMSDLPSWKSVGTIPLEILGFDAIDRPKSPMCRTYWEIEFKGRTKLFLALDKAEFGMTISLSALNYFTYDQGEELGPIRVLATQQDLTSCGFGGQQEKEL